MDLRHRASLIASARGIPSLAHLRTALSLAVALGSIGLLGAREASATSVLPLTIPEMTKASSSIVHGTVVSASSRWSDEHTMIVTDVRVLVHESLKGDAAKEITITQLGGRVGKLQTDVAGALAFRPGEETVLFLAPVAKGGLMVAGLSQGRFEVVTDKAGRKSVRGMSAVVEGSSGKVRSIDPRGTGAPSRGGLRGDEDLDSFLGGIRALVSGADSKGGR